MKTDLELLEEFIEKAKLELLKLETEEAGMQHLQNADFGLSSFGINATRYVQIQWHRDRLTHLMAERDIMIRDEREKKTYIGNIEEIKEHLSQLPSDGKIFKLMEIESNEEA